MSERKVKLPGFPAVTESNLAQVVRLLVERAEVREGARGADLEAVVTRRDLVDMGLPVSGYPARGGFANSGGAGLLVQSASGGLTSMSVEAFSESLRNSKMYSSLAKRLDDATRFDDVPEKVRALLLTDIANEAAIRGADIQRVDYKLQSATESIAYALQEVTAAVADAASGVREVTYSSATENTATAGKITQLSARLDAAPVDASLIVVDVYATLAALTAAVIAPSQTLFYQVTNPVSALPNLLYRFDGTDWVLTGKGLTARLEEVMTVTADRTKGLESQYTLKADTGGAFAAIGLASSTNVAGVGDSAIILRAGKLAFVGDSEVVGTGVGEIDPVNPDLSRIPFGVDTVTNTVFINGALRVGSGSGLTMAELVADSGVTLGYSSQFFKYSSTGTVVNATVTLTATVYGALTGTLSWTAVSGYSGAMPANVTVTAAGVAGTATLNAASLTADTATFKATLTSGTDVFEDTVTVVKLRDGADAYTVRLTNDSAGVACTSAGAPVSGGFGAAVGVMEVYRGADRLNTGVTYTLLTNTNGVTASINSTSGAYSATAAGSWPSATKTAVLTFQAAVTGGPTITKDFVLTKNLQGASGLYKDYVFIRSASAPSAPSTASEPTVQGWFDTPPSGSNPLYMSSSDRDVLTNVVSGTWTTPARLDGASGLPGLDGAYNQTRYAKNTSSTTAPTASETTVATTTSLNVWSFAPPTLSTGQFLWMQIRSVVPPAAAPTWATTTPTRVSGEKGDAGTAGQNMLNVFAYRRSATALTTAHSPGDTSDGNGGASTYTFSTKVLTLPVGTGWSAVIPSGSDPLYVSVASASSATDSDSIGVGEWGDPVKLADNGVNGVNGLNAATVYMYMRTASVALPSISSGAAMTYTFSSKSLAGTYPASTGGTWTALVPASGGDYLWVSMATASSITDTDTIAYTEWSAARLMSTDGVDGLPGAAGQNSAVVYAYQRSATALTSNPGAITYTFSSKSITTPATLLNGWSKTVTAGTTPLHVTACTASSATDTDDIAATEWSSPVIMASNGADGLNAATTYMYMRTAVNVAPSISAGTITYNFTTPPTITGTYPTSTGGTWTGTVPASGGAYLWVSFATAASTTSSDAIAYTEWSAARLMSTDGAAGTAGAAGSTGAKGTRGVIVAKSDMVTWNDTTGWYAIYLIATAVDATATSAIKGDIVHYKGGARECSVGGSPGTWIDVAAYFNGTMVVNGTITANQIIANGITRTAFVQANLQQEVKLTTYVAVASLPFTVNIGQSLMLWATFGLAGAKKVVSGGITYDEAQWALNTSPSDCIALLQLKRADLTYVNDTQKEVRLTVVQGIAVVGQALAVLANVPPAAYTVELRVKKELLLENYGIRDITLSVLETQR